MHTGEYGGIERTMMESKMEREGERTTLASKDKYDSNIKNSSACPKVNFPDHVRCNENASQVIISEYS